MTLTRNPKTQARKKQHSYVQNCGRIEEGRPSGRTRTTCKGGLYANHQVSFRAESLLPFPSAALALFAARRADFPGTTDVVLGRAGALARWPENSEIAETPSVRLAYAAQRHPQSGVRTQPARKPWGVEMVKPQRGERIFLSAPCSSCFVPFFYYALTSGPQCDARTPQKMLNVGHNHEGNPLSHPSKFGIRHNFYKIDNLQHGNVYICRGFTR